MYIIFRRTHKQVITRNKAIARNELEDRVNIV